jgi:N-acetylgalactosamine-6-sulfatase
MYDGGVRVPFIIRWPNHVPAGRLDEQSVISGIDWLPTLASLAGVTFDSAKVEGEDVSQAWLGHTFTRTKPLFWKASAPSSPAGILEGQWKLIRPTGRGDVELYDLAKDPAEATNVAATQPAIAQRLTDKVTAWTKTLPKEYIKASND